MGSVTETIDLKRYGRLLAKAVPRVITTEQESERALAIVESLMEKGEHNMTSEEDALLDLLTNLIRDYEARAYPPRAKSGPHEMVAFLLEQRGLAPKDLWPVIWFERPGIGDRCGEALHQQGTGQEACGVLPRRCGSVHLTLSAIAPLPPAVC